MESLVKNPTQIGERLNKFIIQTFGNLNDAAKLLGMTTSNLTKYLKGERIPGELLLNKFDKYNLNRLWLLYNIEPMYNTNGSATYIKQDANQTTIHEVDISGLMEIEVYQMTVAANRGSLISFEDLPKTKMKLNLNFPNIKPENIKGCVVLGDSMIAEGIETGDWIIFDITETSLRNKLQVIGLLNGYPLVKIYEKIENTIYLKSANPDVEDIIVNEIDDNLIIAGIVKAVIKWK